MVTVLVRHPAPVSYVPARSRRERLALAQIETPVTLRTAGGDEFEPVEWPLVNYEKNHRRVYRNADGFWGRMTGYTGDWKRFVLRADDLAPYLRAEPTRRCHNIHGVAARPTVARRVKGDGLGSSHFDRGERIDLDDARSISLDLREICTAHLRSSLAEDVRIVGDAVYERLPGLMSLRQIRPNGGFTPYPEIHGGPLAFDELVVSTASLAEAMAHFGIERPAYPMLDAWLESVGPGYGRGTEAVHALNGYATTVRDLLVERIAQLRAARDATADGLEQHLADLQGPWLLSLTGSAGLVEPARDLGTVANALEAMMLASPASRGGEVVRQNEGMLLRSLRGFYLPQAQPEIDPEDTAALSALDGWDGGMA